MSYTPEQGLAVALFNTGRFKELSDAIHTANETLDNFRRMGFDVIDFAHTSSLMTPTQDPP